VERLVLIKTCMSLRGQIVQRDVINLDNVIFRAAGELQRRRRGRRTETQTTNSQVMSGTKPHRKTS